MTPDQTSNSLDAIISVLASLDRLGLGLVLILFGLLVYLVWRRKYAKDGDFSVLPAVLVAPKKLELPADSLTKPWRGFIAAIAWRLRRDVLSLPLSLVIGDAGSGKTGIIDRYAHWQGQDYLFHPSATNDPLLQIYAGAKSLVLEFGSQLLYDSHPAAYRAIKKLWGRLPRNPQAVVVIDATTLLFPQAELLRHSGLAIFGKLKVFARLEGKPLPLVLALSHMEQFKGFVEFCRFLGETGIPLRIEFPEQDGVERLASCLNGFKQHLPRALVNCSAQDYLKIVSFLNEAPQLLAVLQDFLRVAGFEQGLESPPIIRLCLFSNQVESFGCQPFALAEGFVKSALLKLNVHAKAALILFTLGIAYFLGSYSYQQDMIDDVWHGIQTVAQIPVEQYEEKISPLFLDFSVDLHKDPLLSFMPNYFDETDKVNKYLLIREIRKYYLLPLLKQIQYEKNAVFKTNRFLGLLYATPTNEIGKILARHPEKNPVDMHKYGLLISDYIKYNSHTDELDLLLKEITYTKPQTYIEDFTPWLTLFRSFQQLLTKPYITQIELLTLQNQLSPFVEVIDKLNYYQDQTEIVNWLNQYTSLHPENQNQSQLKQKGIEQLLVLVQHLKLDNVDNCAANQPLGVCLLMAQTVANAKQDVSESEIAIGLDHEHFAFTSGQWTALIARSRVSLLLDALMQNHRIIDGWLFFGTPGLYGEVEMGSANPGQTTFAGKARIDGRLSSDAFEQKVKPIIVGLPALVAGLPIDELQKKHFSDFVQRQLNAYADNYVSAYLNYFRQFQVRIDSSWGLNFILDDLQQPNSQLLQMLVQIKTNTALNLPSTPSFQPFAQKLAVFRYIQHLMEEKGGIYPEFQKYQFMMAQMQHEMDSREPYTPKKATDSAAALKGAMTPIARVAWAMRFKEEGSYLSFVKTWLQEVGILQDWQQPFLAPVLKVAEYGTAEINQHIEAIWNDLWDANIEPLLIKFPFNANAGSDKELTAEDLSKIFHPKQGIFWVTFREYLASLANYSNGVWVKPYELSDSLALPVNFLARLNAIQQLTSSLWDAQGNAKPLELSVKPGYLPTFDNRQIPNAPLVSLAYLRNGAVSVLGFNQHAEWQKLALEWWSGQPAEVGMEFRKDAGPTRVYTDINLPASPWSFFRLLQQANRLPGEQNYQWSLAHPSFPQQPLTLEFSFQADPLAVFSNLAGK